MKGVSGLPVGLSRGAAGAAAELAVRAVAMPALLGARLLARALPHEIPEIPRPALNLQRLGKVVLDEIFLSTELVSATILAPGEHARVVREVDEALALFETAGWLDEPAAYHEAPTAPARAAVDQFSSLWGPYHHLRFESGYEPHAGEPGRERWLSYAPNHQAHAWLLEHPGPPRPWLVCIPGYRMGAPAVDFTGFRTRWLHLALGLNVAIPVLPFHGPRRVGRRGGDGFLAGDLLDTVHAQTQAVWDVRRLLVWLRTQRASSVGIYGVSLGGYTAALVAELESELACAIAGNPATDFLRLVRANLPPFLFRLAERAGFPFGSADRLFRVISPLVLPPRIALERRFIYAGLFDRLAPPEHAHRLWTHWERPTLHWYEGSHLSFVWEKRIETLLTEAFRTSGLLPEA